MPGESYIKYAARNTYQKLMELDIAMLNQKIADICLLVI